MVFSEPLERGCGTEIPRCAYVTNALSAVGTFEAVAEVPGPADPFGTAADHADGFLLMLPLHAAGIHILCVVDAGVLRAWGAAITIWVGAITITVGLQANEPSSAIALHFTRVADETADALLAQFFFASSEYGWIRFVAHRRWS